MQIPSGIFVMQLCTVAQNRVGKSTNFSKPWFAKNDVDDWTFIVQFNKFVNLYYMRFLCFKALRLIYI